MTTTIVTQAFVCVCTLLTITLVAEFADTDRHLACYRRVGAGCIGITTPVIDETLVNVDTSVSSAFKALVAFTCIASWGIDTGRIVCAQGVSEFAFIKVFSTLVSQPTFIA